MIHSAITESLERCIAVLLEHLEGNLPLWLAPVQVAVLPVSQKHEAYAQGIVKELKDAGIRVELSADDSLGKRIRQTKIEKVPAYIVVGDKEAADGTVTVENNRNGDKQTVALADFIAPTLERIKERANI